MKRRMREKETGEQLEKGVRRGLDDCAKDTLDKARENAPVRTGELRDSLKNEDMPGGARVYTACGHAASVEFGKGGRGANPFLSSAFDGRECLKRVEACVKGALKG